jgi:beta-glucosidase
MTKLNPQTLQFPSDFLWGTATSSYQIEGAVAQDGRTPSIWDTFCQQPGRVLNGDTGEIACASYERVEEDVALLKNLGAKAYRFSISWSRVLPQGRGPLNPLGVAYYQKLVRLLREAGIAPMVTLYHWDLPQCLQDEGGWLQRSTAHAFADYAQAMYEALGSDVPFWFTINEPWCVSLLSHAIGEHAPGEQNLQNAITVAHHVLMGHGLAVQRFRAGKFKGQIGMAPNVEWREPFSQHADDVAACERGIDWFNRWFLDPIFKGRYPQNMLERYAQLGVRPPIEAGDMELISQRPDMLGINYYTGSYSRAGNEDLQAAIGKDSKTQLAALTNVVGVDSHQFKRTDIGWGIFPEGFYKVLLWLRDEYNNPAIFITENGACDNTVPDASGVVNDEIRTNYYRQHVAALHRAMQSGCNIRGYMAWSLLDNFEWAWGFSKRFGLVYVDFASLKRIPKASYAWYQALIANRGLTL